MGYEIALIVIQFLILLAIMPVRVSARGHISLEHMSAAVDVSAYFLRVVRLRLKNKDGKMKLTLNGKKPKKGNFDAEKLLTLPCDLPEVGIKFGGEVIAAVGASDAKDAAMFAAAVLAVIPAVQGKNVYACEEERFELGFDVKLKINLLQLAQLAL